MRGKNVVMISRFRFIALLWCRLISLFGWAISDRDDNNNVRRGAWTKTTDRCNTCWSRVVFRFDTNALATPFLV